MKSAKSVNSSLKQSPDAEREESPELSINLLKGIKETPAKRETSTSKKSKKRQLTVETLTGPAGISSLISMAKKLNLKHHDSAISKADRIMTMYHKWSNTMFPEAEFESVVNQTEALGSRSVVCDLMAQYRRVEEMKYVNREGMDSWITSTDDKRRNESTREMSFSDSNAGTRTASMQSTNSMSNSSSHRVVADDDDDVDGIDAVRSLPKPRHLDSTLRLTSTTPVVVPAHGHEHHQLIPSDSQSTEGDTQSKSSLGKTVNSLTALSDDENMNEDLSDSS